MTTIYKLGDPCGLLPAARYITETRAALIQIEQLLANAAGWRQVHPAVRLRNLSESANNALSELARTAVTKVVSP